jgi:glycosyltransferase involved in cell wall biosynthesis
MTTAPEAQALSTSEKKPPLISIVSPCYNVERFLPFTLRSIVSQTLGDWELVLVDDASTDATASVGMEFAAQDPRIRLIKGEKAGSAAARNRGFPATDPGSEYVIFIDSDDLWEPDTLDVLVNVLRSRPDYVSAYGLVRSVDMDGEFIPDDTLLNWMRERRGYRNGELVRLEPTEPTTFAEMVVESWLVTPGTHLIRRHVYEQVGGFDSRAVPADDWDMAIRISRLGPIGFVDQPVLRWRRHPNALSNVSDNWRQGYFLVRDKTLERGPEPVAVTDGRAGQADAARRAYVGVVAQRFRAGWSLLRARDPKGAMRQVGRAGYGFWRFVRAVIVAKRTS